MASLLQYLRALWHATIDKKNTSSGIRTRNLRIRSPTRYPLRHGGNKERHDPGGTRTHNR